MGGRLEVYEVPGDHLDIIETPYLHFWAGRLKAALISAQDSLTPNEFTAKHPTPNETGDHLGLEFNGSLQK